MRRLGTDPVRMAEKIRVPRDERSTGFHAWPGEEIAQYRARHPLGTSARLATELMLWTGRQRVNAIRLGPDDVLNGRVAGAQSKRGKGLRLGLGPRIHQEALAMTPLPGAS
jgi:hypothetical protein